MRKFIDKDTWSQIKGKYVAGKDTISKIADDHSISRKSIQRKAQKDGWVYGSSKDEVSKAIENATIETIIGTGLDKAVKITERFIKDSENVRNVTMAILSGMVKELQKSGGNIKADEANRLLSCQRVAKTTMETITGNYNAVRKALGMDKDEDIRKAKEIKATENTLVIDPLEGKTLDEAKEELRKLKSR